jgi:hypothetical protein
VIRVLVENVRRRLRSVFILSNIFSKSHTWFQVSIDSAATNDDLAKEIANYLGREPNTFTLELPGGFELRGQE